MRNKYGIINIDLGVITGLETSLDITNSISEFTKNLLFDLAKKTITLNGNYVSNVTKFIYLSFIDATSYRNVKGFPSLVADDSGESILKLIIYINSVCYLLEIDGNLETITISVSEL